MCIATEESFYILRYSAEAVEKAKEQPDSVTEDGIEEAFDVSSTPHYCLCIDTLPKTCKKIKVARTRLPSVWFRS